MPNQTRHYMVSIDENINATRWGTHDSHKCYNWSQNLSCYEGKIFKNEGGGKSTFVPFGKIRCNKIHDAPLASTSKATLIYVSNSLSIPSYLVESLHTILKKMINIELAKKDMVITKLRMENQCTKLHLPSQGRHPTY